mgnify:CR=1 FL=1
MVRLKDPISIYSISNFFISIPYGAIKSYRACFGRIFPVGISIPYGAIKSIIKSILLNTCTRISIPYGAIKR